MKRLGLVFLFIFSVLLIVPNAGGESGSQPATGISEQEIQDFLQKKEARLSLNACLQLALKNNLEIAIQRVEPEISEQKLVQEKSVFDSRVSVGVSKDQSVKQTSSSFASPPENKNQDYNINAGIARKWAPGTETDLSAVNNRNETNSAFAGLNPSYSSELILSLTQPLLKDFGIGTNTSGIRIAANNKEISRFQFQSHVMQILFDVESIYWELVYTIEDQKVQQESLQLAEDFLKITRSKVEVGVLPPIDILEAEAEKAAREEGVITAEDALRDAEDSLRKALNLTDDPRYWEIRLTPADEPVVAAEIEDLPEQIRTAMESRPDIHQAKVDLENKQIQLKYTKNQLFPRVDLVGSIGLSGLSGAAQPQPDFRNPGATTENPFGGNNPDSLRELKSGDYYSYTVGIKVEYPLGNRSARSEKVMADLENQKAVMAVKDLENQVIRDVREAYRQIETDRKRVAAAEAARRLAEERLRSETQRFEVGLGISHDVLEYQEKLSTARSRELRARVDFRKSLAHLEQIKGTLLQSKGIGL